MKKHIKTTGAAIFVLLLLITGTGFSQDGGTVSFAKQNKSKHYTSFALGMGAAYGNNKSLNTFIGYELPGYNNVADSRKLKDFKTGFEFFGMVERQVASKIAVKLDYSYFLKSNKVDDYPNQSFDYTNHQILLGANYLIPGEYYFLKFGVSAGPVFSSLDSKSYTSNYGIFTSTGLLAKAEGSFSVQMGSSLAGYISGYVGNVFAGNLKDGTDKEIKNAAGETVNLSSFMLGVRLGIEFYIF